MRLGSEFYSTAYKCKACVCRQVQQNRKRNIDYYRAYDKNRWHNDPERRAAVYASLRAAAARDPERYASYKKKYAETHADRIAALHSAYAEKFPAAYAARTAVGNAVRDGRLTRGPCEVCGAVNVHGHHDDYAEPLAVRWLCPKHHTEWHSQNGPGKNLS